VSNWTIALLVPGPRVLRLLQTPGAFIYLKVFQVVASERSCRLQIEIWMALQSGTKWSWICLFPSNLVSHVVQFEFWEEQFFSRTHAAAPSIWIKTPEDTHEC